MFNLKVEHPAQNLFFWALVLNRVEIAKVFWQVGKVKNLLFIVD
jgi:hypothetical protein